MAIWEQPGILSGTSPNVGPDGQKAELGLCIIHQNNVTMEWAMRFRLLQMPPYIYMLNRNQPYDTAREMVTRAVLEQGVKRVLHIDSDVLLPVNAVPLMIEWAEKFKIPFLSGLYWAKKPGPPMPAAWIKTGEKPEENKIEFMPADLSKQIGTQAIVPVDVVGAGCMLIDADVFKKLDESDPKKPYFQWGLGRHDKDGKPLRQMSEDFYFCMRCVEELDIHPHVATAIQCDHEAKVHRRGKDGELELLMRI